MVNKVKRNKRKNASKKVNKSRKQNWINKTLKVKPRSEIWFDNKMLEVDLRFPFDENVIFAGKCPDYISKHYKVIVEVDGTWHDQDYVKRQDEYKTKKYESLGYEVIRVIAYDKGSLTKCLDRLKTIRLSKPQL